MVDYFCAEQLCIQHTAGHTAARFRKRHLRRVPLQVGAKQAASSGLECLLRGFCRTRQSTRITHPDGHAHTGCAFTPSFSSTHRQAVQVRTELKPSAEITRLLHSHRYARRRRSPPDLSLAGCVCHRTHSLVACNNATQNRQQTMQPNSSVVAPLLHTCWGSCSA